MVPEISLNHLMPRWRYIFAHDYSCIRFSSFTVKSSRRVIEMYHTDLGQLMAVIMRLIRRSASAAGASVDPHKGPTVSQCVCMHV